MNREEFESSLARDGFEMREAAMEPGHINEEHSHPFDARLYVLTGQLIIEHQGKISTCGPGDTFALSANIPHKERVGMEGVTYIAGRRMV
jgi:quercetin dioxygenase-like cupin family protein